MKLHSLGLSGQAALVSVLLSLCGPAWAQEGGSLAERRLAIQKGTAPGKVLIDAPAPAAPAAPAASAAATPAPPAPRAGLLSRLPPPSGRPLNAARKLDAPDQGIVIKPAAPSASAPR
jgi:hypothetical protein